MPRKGGLCRYRGAQLNRGSERASEMFTKVLKTPYERSSGECTNPALPPKLSVTRLTQLSLTASADRGRDNMAWLDPESSGLPLTIAVLYFENYTKLSEKKWVTSRKWQKLPEGAVECGDVPKYYDRRRLEWLHHRPSSFGRLLCALCGNPTPWARGTSA